MALRCCRLTLQHTMGSAKAISESGEMQYVGGSISAFETCLDDLDALVGLARGLCSRVVLQGHSLGCDRVLFYARERGVDIPLILLSPCDSYQLQESWLGHERVSEQVARLRDGVDVTGKSDWCRRANMVWRGPDGWTYSIPITRPALLSVVGGAPFEILRVDSAAQPVSDSPAFAYVGSEDAIRGVALKELVRHVRRLVPAVRVFEVEGGDHSLDGCEGTVAEAIVGWAYEERLLAVRRKRDGGGGKIGGRSHDGD